jgi:hypothetical protein
VVSGELPPEEGGGEDSGPTLPVHSHAKAKVKRRRRSVRLSRSISSKFKKITTAGSTSGGGNISSSSSSSSSSKSSRSGGSGSCTGQSSSSRVHITPTASSVGSGQLAQVEANTSLRGFSVHPTRSTADEENSSTRCETSHIRVPPVCSASSSVCVANACDGEDVTHTPGTCTTPTPLSPSQMVSNTDRGRNEQSDARKTKHKTGANSKHKTRINTTTTTTTKDEGARKESVGMCEEGMHTVTATVSVDIRNESDSDPISRRHGRHQAIMHHSKLGQMLGEEQRQTGGGSVGHGKLAKMFGDNLVSLATHVEDDPLEAVKRMQARKGGVSQRARKSIGVVSSKKCFSGEEVVIWMIKHFNITHSNAISFGDLLLRLCLVFPINYQVGRCVRSTSVWWFALSNSQTFLNFRTLKLSRTLPFLHATCHLSLSLSLKLSVFVSTRLLATWCSCFPVLTFVLSPRICLCCISVFVYPSVSSVHMCLHALCVCVCMCVGVFCAISGL